MLWTRAGAADHPTSKTSPNQRIETQNALRHRTSIGHASAPYRANNAGRNLNASGRNISLIAKTVVNAPRAMTAILNEDYALTHIAPSATRPRRPKNPVALEEATGPTRRPFQWL